MVYPIAKWTVTPIYKLWLRKTEGLENIPKNDPFIMAANHSSYYDAALLHSIIIPKINKRVHALVNSHYWENFVTKAFLDWGESIPVFVEKEKGSNEKNKLAFKKALNYLKNKEIVLIFPEGTRSYDGKLKKAYNGIAKICLEAKVPILPVGIIGSCKVLPKGKILPRFKRCEVNIGKLMSFEKYYNKKINKNLLEEVTRSIMKQIAKLIGQQYNH